MIYIDHGIVLKNFKQIILIIFSTIKLNLRFIRISEYIQKFRNLKFRHKSGKQYIIPNALSRFNQESNVRSESDDQFDDFFYHIIFVEIFNDFKTRFKIKYVKNSQ